MRCQEVSREQQSSGKIERHENGFVEKSVAEEDDTLRWSKLGQGRQCQAKPSATKYQRMGKLDLRW